MPELLLACITCNVYKTSKFTANRDLKLLGTCKNCDTDFRRSTKLIMNWLVVSSSGSTVLNISKSKTEHEDLFIIKQNTLNKAESYTIQFSTTISGNQCVFMLFFTNLRHCRKDAIPCSYKAHICSLMFQGFQKGITRNADQIGSNGRCVSGLPLIWQLVGRE